MKLTPTAVCRTRAWPSPGSPTSTSSQRRTSGPPVSWKRMIFAMSVSFWCLSDLAWFSQHSNGLAIPAEALGA